jgi:superfamily II DNA/RNA helicase
MQNMGLDSLPDFKMFSKIRARLASDRIKALEELVEGFEDAGEPVVVFSAHRAPVEAMAKRDGWAVIMGDTPQKARQQAVEDFQSGVLKGIACTIKAGGTGITLTRASKMIFCDLEWNPALNMQAEDRIRRIGQKASSLQYIRLVSDHAMDLHVLNLLSEKTALINDAIENEVGQLTSTNKGDSVTVIQETREQRDARIAKASQKAARKAAQRKVSSNKGQWVGRMNGFSATAIPTNVKHSIPQAVAYMQSICDGAFAKDAQGFNAPDASIMHTITTSQLLSKDEDLLRFCWWTLRKYKGQCQAKFPSLY